MINESDRPTRTFRPVVTMELCTASLRGRPVALVLLVSAEHSDDVIRHSWPLDAEGRMTDSQWQDVGVCLLQEASNAIVLRLSIQRELFSSVYRD